jgi:hypothetical protein
VNGKNRSAAFDGRAAFLGRTNFDFVTGTQLVGLVTGHGNFVTLNGVNRTSQGRGRGGAYRSNEEKQGTYGTKHFFCMIFLHFTWLIQHRPSRADVLADSLSREQPFYATNFQSSETTVFGIGCQ